VGIRLISADWMVIMENEKLKRGKMYYVMVYTR